MRLLMYYSQEIDTDYVRWIDHAHLTAYPDGQYKQVLNSAAICTLALEYLGAV